MAFVLADRVRDTTNTTGTGAVTLSGTAPIGYQTFGAAIGGGNSTYYCIAGQNTTQWEVGIGTYTSFGTSLSRDTVLASSNSGSLVTFSSGDKDVFVTYPAEKSVNYDSSGNIINTGSLSFTGTGKTITGDFTNATVSNRLNFQTSTVNSTTGIYALPNGTSTAASWQAANNSDPTNASKVLIAAESASMQLVSGRNGSGTYLPLVFYTNGAEKMRLDTSGNLGVGVTPSGSYTVESVGAISGTNLLATNGLLVEGNTVSVSYTVPASSNALSIGPITVASGVTVTIPSGSRWVVA